MLRMRFINQKHINSFHTMSDWLSLWSCAACAEIVDHTVDVDNLNRVEALAMSLVANAHFLRSVVQKR